MTATALVILVLYLVGAGLTIAGLVQAVREKNEFEIYAAFFVLAIATAGIAFLFIYGGNFR